MEHLQYTDFRNHSREYFEQVEAGKSFIIIRKGRPVARLVPFESRETGWKRDVYRVRLQGAGPTAAESVAEERAER